jgi:uncharacterized membrane protein
MNLAPFFVAPAVVQMHAAGAFLALATGSAVLFMRKGTTTHRISGQVWAALMVFVALTSFAITGTRPPGHFSAIHILSVITLISIPAAILYRRKGNIRRHAIIMVSTFLGLFIAGGFTLIPGRLMNAIVFGP